MNRWWIWLKLKMYALFASDPKHRGWRRDRIPAVIGDDETVGYTDKHGQGHLRAHVVRELMDLNPDAKWCVLE